MRLGTCSWADQGLLARWYPAGVRDAAARLAYYAGRFDVVEVDSPFYRLPAPETTARWAERTPPGFVFHVKASGEMTGHRQADRDTAFRAFREAVAPLEAAGFLAGHAALYWDRVDEWLVEDEQVHGHPRDPYHRIDVYRTTRRVRVSLDGEELADSVRALALFETALPPRWYLPPEDVRTELLEPSSSRSRCAYKGSASYWHVRTGGGLHDDLAWSYPDPDDDARDVRDLICFFDERVDVEVAGVAQERPVTQWSRG